MFSRCLMIESRGVGNDADSMKAPQGKLLLALVGVMPCDEEGRKND